jgi:hypothetical protein
LFVVAAADEVVSCDLAGGAALLDTRSNVYFTLNGVGAHIWSAIQHPTTVAEIIEKIVAQYEVDRVRCQGDVVALLQQLDDAGLIKILEETPAQVHNPERVG